MNRQQRLLLAMQARDKRIKQQHKAEYQEEASYRDVPVIYSTFAVSLMEAYGWETEQIEELFAMTQELWNQYTEQNYSLDDILKDCEERTGITLLNPKQAEEQNLTP